MPTNNIESVVGNLAAVFSSASDIARGARRLRDFVRLAWHVTEPATPFVDGFHLDAVCDHLQAVTTGGIRNLVINLPPRHMKSLAVCVFWPAWVWITFPHRRFLFASYAQALSERDSVKCRRLMESPWYQEHFGGCFALSPDQNTKTRYDNNFAGHRIATSVGGAATGEGGDYVVVDDPHNVIDRESDAKREEALIWWDETMSTRLNNPKTGAKIIIMQRIHEKDLSGHVLEQGGYVHLLLPAEFEPARRCVTTLSADRSRQWRDPRDAEGELLWPARVGDDEIADFRVRLGPQGYAGQFQQRPSPAGGAVFRKEWFRYYKGSAEKKVLSAECADKNLQRKTSSSLSTQHSELSTFPPLSTSYALITPGETETLISASDCQRIAVMDPAGTEPGHGRRPCFTVIQVWDITERGDMLLIHQYRRQVQAADAARAAIDICRDFEVAYIAIEKDGMGLGVVQQVRNSGIAVRAVKARGCKESRTQTAEIRMANGQIYFPSGAAFLFELEKELLSFPRSDYADQVDALAHAAILVQKMCRPHETEPVESWEHDAEQAIEAEEPDEHLFA